MRLKLENEEIPAALLCDAGKPHKYASTVLSRVLMVNVLLPRTC